MPRKRAKPSGRALTASEASVAKAMLLRGDRQYDIAAWFGVNGGRIAEISTGARFGWIEPTADILPPSGPYPCGQAAIKALTEAKAALAAAEKIIAGQLSEAA